MFLSCQALEETNKNDLWLLDNGCNNHMIGNKDLFSSVNSCVKSKINLGDDHKVNALGKGTIMVFSKQNEKKNF